MDPPGVVDLCMVPAATPPVGTQPNFDNPETLTPVIVPICVIMCVLAIVFTSCRLFANWRKLGWSDYFVVISLVFFIPTIGFAISQTQFARHQWDTRACQYDDRFVKLLLTESIFQSLVLFFSKASILLLFYQIFNVKASLRIAIRAGIIFPALLCLVNTILAVIFLVPRGGETWASLLTRPGMRRSFLWVMIYAVFGTLLDLFIFILPIPLILTLRLSVKRKIQILAVFSTALVGVFAGVLTLVYRVRAWKSSQDSSWEGAIVMLCTIVENGVAIIVSCAPGFANFTRTYLLDSSIIKTLRRSLGGGNRGKSERLNKLPFNKHRENPNRPRTKDASAKTRDPMRGVLSDSYILKSMSSTDRPELDAAHGLSLLPSFDPIAIPETSDVPQQPQQSNSLPGSGIPTRHIQTHQNGVFYYGPYMAQPSSQPVWFYYVPSQDQQLGETSQVRYNNLGTDDSSHHDFHISREGLVRQTSSRS